MDVRRPGGRPRARDASQKEAEEKRPMGNILENIGKIHIAVVKDKETGDGELGQTLGEFAVAAIMGGIKSEAWKTYMSIYADNADQLKLLTEVGNPEDDYLSQTRAYIVSNAVCAA